MGDIFGPIYFGSGRPMQFAKTGSRARITNIELAPSPPWVEPSPKAEACEPSRFAEPNRRRSPVTALRCSCGGELALACFVCGVPDCGTSHDFTRMPTLRPRSMVCRECSVVVEDLR